MTEGKKNDFGKPHMCLLPPKAILAVGEVLTYGANKYAPDNWRDVQPRCRYLSAILRHWLAIVSGEDTDPETGLPHLAHLSCSALFLLELQLEGKDVRDWKENKDYFKKKEEVSAIYSNAEGCNFLSQIGPRCNAKVQGTHEGKPYCIQHLVQVKGEHPIAHYKPCEYRLPEGTPCNVKSQNIYGGVWLCSGHLAEALLGEKRS